VVQSRKELLISAVEIRQSVCESGVSLLISVNVSILAGGTGYPQTGSGRRDALSAGVDLTVDHCSREPKRVAQCGFNHCTLDPWSMASDILWLPSTPGHLGATVARSGYALVPRGSLKLRASMKYAKCGSQECDRNISQGSWVLCMVLDLHHRCTNVLQISSSRLLSGASYAEKG
jgi:hypothetical protein